MEIRQLKTFHTVATLMSFHGAAKALHYAQSTVSAQIQALEESLDVKLFERLGKRIFLTAAGSKLLGYASKMVDLSEEARAEVSESCQAQGSLKVRMPESLVMQFGSELISQFAAVFPEVRLAFTSCAYHGLQEDLRKGVTDLAFLLAENLISSNLEVTIL
ncbi:MAG: LysR family transcriptional regulator, partial [Proteobacteria bacterium]|nr:LysR family transcriptional regulator [Pseudomonadota bacterium]